jgi:hypothetical protein
MLDVISARFARSPPLPALSETLAIRRWCPSGRTGPAGPPFGSKTDGVSVAISLAHARAWRGYDPVAGL